jgi:ketosteroid isomerase-like protein
MKKIVLFVITIVSIFGCTQKKEADDNLLKYKKNLLVAKQFIQSFSTKDSAGEAALFSEDFKFDGSNIGTDSGSKADLIAGDKKLMRTFNDIKLENADYYPGVDSSYKISSEVRVYGTWVSKFASTGKISRMKYYAILKFNDDGLITNLEERCNLADLSKQLDE